MLRLLPAALACILVLGAGGPGGALAVEAARIVSGGGAVTEIVHALGMGDRLVGVDMTSLHPPKVRYLPQIGYPRELSAEGVVSLEPDLVLLSGDAGPPAVLDQLRRLLGDGLRIVPYDPSPEGLLVKVVAVGAALGREAEGRALAAGIDARLAEVRQAIEAAEVKEPGRPRVLFLMGAGRGSPMAAGSGTAAEAMIRLAGGTNAMEGYHGYKPAAAEAILAAAPDFILVPDNVVEALGGEAAVLALPQLAGTPAAREGRLLSMDPLYLLGFGPRLPEAVADLARMLHPSTAIPDPHPDEGLQKAESGR